MAGLDVSGLTLNPKENAEFQEFIMEKAMLGVDFKQVHAIKTGVKMKEQIVLASLFGMTGLKGDSSSDRKKSGATSTLSQKYWEPAGIEDTLEFSPKSLGALFKAYFDKITTYRENYEIEGTDLEIFLMILFEESISKLIWRASWFADKSVAAADASNAGLVDGANVKFYDYFDGLWVQIFAAVTATTINRVTITENSAVTKNAQLTLAAGASVAYFKQIRSKAKADLKNHPLRRMEVTGEMYENYTDYLTSINALYDTSKTEEGFDSVKWNGWDIINMETVWDTGNRDNFVADTTDNLYYLPNRIVASIPENMPVGTLNEKDFDDIEVWYNQTARMNYMAFGFSLDSKVIEEDMIVVAY